ncbi:hypothetical protein [Moorena producens]|uniref:hypothetical protein n=1 Tax=Moorena producens TaxID=1155739 RepID=UPI003C74A262
MGRWGDGDPPLTPPRRGMGRWGPTPNPSQEGDGEMGKIFIKRCSAVLGRQRRQRGSPRRRNLITLSQNGW